MSNEKSPDTMILDTLFDNLDFPVLVVLSGSSPNLSITPCISED